MKKRTEFTIIKWKVDGTKYGFDNPKQMLEIYEQQRKLLKSDEKLEVIRTEIEEYDYVVPAPHSPLTRERK